MVHPLGSLPSLIPMMILRIAGTVSESIVDGPGFRFALFAQGCPHKCPGCHNPQTHDLMGGREVSILAIMRQIWHSRKHLNGITLSGGEPFSQPCALYHIARWAHKLNLNVYCYSGFTYEQLKADPECVPLLNELDVLVDGPFIQEKRSLDIRFRGSINQRVLTLKQGEIIKIE